MASIETTSLKPREQRVLDRLVRGLHEEFGPELHAVWLYGSRARGEPPGPESDVDLLVILDGDSWSEQLRVERVITRAAEAEGESPVWFAAHVYSPERIAQRREIRSFFIQEVDRDKVVLFGEP